MHPIESSERPSPAIAAPASSPAPADAGQGVGTLSAWDREQVEALTVLREMAYLADSKSPEGKALSIAVSVMSIRLQDRGIQA